jgi:hypothetical protein
MQTKERTITFRVDDRLYCAIQAFAKKYGYANISELLREVIVMHFMGFLLGHFEWDFDKLREEYLTKNKDVNENEGKN